MKRQMLRKALRNVYFMLGSFMILLLLIMMVWGMIGTPHPPNYISFGNSSLPPSTTHFFGTDTLGRDVFSRVLVGSRSAFGTGVISTAISLVIGALLGLVSGFAGRRIDIVLTRMTDVMRSIPSILFAMMIVAILGSSFTNIIIALCFISIPNFYRIVRASVMQVKNREYVIWTKLVGIGWWRTILLHILPNIRAPLIVMSTLNIARAVITESSLSYLGIGIQPPHPSWGHMLSDAQVNILHAPWEAISVGVCLSILVLGFNLLGDGLRDLLDVRSV